MWILICWFSTKGKKEVKEKQYKNSLYIFHAPCIALNRLTQVYVYDLILCMTCTRCSGLVLFMSQQIISTLLNVNLSTTKSYLGITNTNWWIAKRSACWDCCQKNKIKGKKTAKQLLLFLLPYRQKVHNLRIIRTFSQFKCLQMTFFFFTECPNKMFPSFAPYNFAKIIKNKQKQR